MELRDLIHLAVARKASDVHVHPGRSPAFRLDGSICPQSEFPVLSGPETQKLLFAALTPEQREQVERNQELDCSLQMDFADGVKTRLRANIQHQLGGWGGVFRLIPEQIPSAEDLVLEPSLQRLSELPRGLVLITGPTGSGKSTTLACLVESINRRYRRHILTIEDPIEYVYHPKQCDITQRELGTHTHGFAPALKSALRADPDVILVGEMRDLETIQLALTASETGHLVFSTLHTTDASQTVDRIIDVFPPAQQFMVRSQLGSVLQAVVSQVLLPHASGTGRVAAREILIANAALRTLIREQHTNQIYSALSSGISQGMCTLEWSLAHMIRSGALTETEASSAANRPAILKSYLSRREVKSFH